MENKNYEKLEKKYNDLLEHNKKLEERLKSVDFGNKLEKVPEHKLERMYNHLGKNLLYAIAELGTYNEEEINQFYDIIIEFGFEYTEQKLLENIEKDDKDEINN